MNRNRSSETGAALGEILSQRGLSQASLANVTGTSQPYINQVVRGKRLVSGAWLNVVAAGLSLSDDERVRLHRAAAKDHGYEIDLTQTKLPDPT